MAVGDRTPALGDPHRSGAIGGWSEAQWEREAGAGTNASLSQGKKRAEGLAFSGLPPHPV